MKLFFLCFFIFTSKAFLLTAQIRINIYDQRDHYEKVNLSEVADSIVYIPLETTDSCLLSDELQIFTVKMRYSLEIRRMRGFTVLINTDPF